MLLLDTVVTLRQHGSRDATSTATATGTFASSRPAAAAVGTALLLAAAGAPRTLSGVPTGRQLVERQLKTGERQRGRPPTRNPRTGDGFRRAAGPPYTTRAGPMGRPFRISAVDWNHRFAGNAPRHPIRLLRLPRQGPRQPTNPGGA